MKYLLYIFILFLLSHFNIKADIRYVSKTGSNTPPYLSWETASDSIQKCIDICNNGDTVYVRNGIYKESLIINKSIALLGSSMDSTIIDGTGLADYTININYSSNIKIESFNIYGKGKNYSNSCAIVSYSVLTISSCRIKNCNLGIGLLQVSATLDNILISNSEWGYSGGCYSHECQTFISNCVIVLDAASYSYGIDISIGGDYFINNNILLYLGTNYSSYGIFLGWPDKVHIYNNLISGFKNNIKIDLSYDSTFIINNNIMNKRRSSLGTDDGSIDTENDNVIIKNNILTNNKNSAVRGTASFVNLDYNIYWGNDNDLYMLNYGNGDQKADPMFVKDTIPASNFDFDFHLQAFSPGIDKGDPTILDKDGSRSDVGMYGGPYGESYNYKNYAPKAPVNVSAIIDSQNITINWNKNSEADTAFYYIYRDTTANFSLDSTKLISKQRSNQLIQSKPGTPKRFYYKLTAEDTEGNISEPSKELMVNVTGIEKEPVIVSDYALYQNYPNPFNPATVIGYRLKENGYVKIMVYNITGELLKTLVNETKEAGYYEQEFNATGLPSGIYLYRIEIIGKGNISVYTDMRKCVFIK